MSYKDLKKDLKQLFGKHYDYESLNKRKSSNEKFCEFLGITIGKLRDEIAVVKNIALQSQMIMIWGDLDKFLFKLNDIDALINERDFSSSTFFRSKKKIKEEIEKIVKAEHIIVELMKEVISKTEEFKDAVDSALLSEITRLTGELTQLIVQVENQWKERSELIKNFKYI